MGPPLAIDELLIADPPAAWRAAGFRVGLGPAIAFMSPGPGGITV